jgi:hypothetical protein
MHKFTTLGVAALLTLGGPALAASPALASSGHGKHSPPMNLSFAGGDDNTTGQEGSAHWSQRKTAVQLKVEIADDSTSGDDSGDDSSGGDVSGDATSAPAAAFAQVVIHHVPATPPAEPTMTVVPKAGDGAPYLEIDFAGGGFLVGVPAGGTMTWTPFDSTGSPLGPGTDYAGALAAEGPSPAVTGVSVFDSSPSGGTFTDTITSLQYNGVNLLPGTNRGHGASGHGASGHSASGHSASGHSASGHSASGHGASGHSASGHSGAGHGRSSAHHA